MGKIRQSSAIDWSSFLGQRLPEIFDRLTEDNLLMLAGRPESHDRLHSHAHPELCVVLAGRMRLLNEGEPINLEAGQALLVAPRMWHASTAIGRSAETLWLGATPNHMGGAVARLSTRGRSRTVGGLDFLDFRPGSILMHRLVDEAVARELGWMRMCRALLNELCTLALRNLSRHGRQLPPDEQYSSAQIVTYNARYYIQKNYHHPITLAQVAHHVALSPNYLASLFKRQFGRTIVDYLTEVRIEEAKRLLRETELKVSRIASEVGYNSPYYFSRAFKQVAGCSPRQYRSRGEDELAVDVS